MQLSVCIDVHLFVTLIWRFDGIDLNRQIKITTKSNYVIDYYLFNLPN